MLQWYGYLFTTVQISGHTRTKHACSLYRHSIFWCGRDWIEFSIVPGHRCCVLDAQIHMWMPMISHSWPGLSSPSVIVKSPFSSPEGSNHMVHDFLLVFTQDGVYMQM